MKALFAACFAALLVSNPLPQESTVLKGKVTLKGEVPPRKMLKVNPSLEEELRAYPDGIPYDPVPVDKDRGVASVVVYVKTGLERKSFPVPQEPVRLDVVKFQFVPRIFPIMAGQKLLMTNQDGGLHSVAAYPSVEGNKMFNTGIAGKGTSAEKVFAKPEIGIPIRATEHHEWERSWAIVLPHPFHAVTDDHGAYQIRGLPSGKYTLEAWQENCDPVTQSIEIDANGKGTADFILEARRP